MASSLSVLPLDFVLGVHDLAAIILDAHSRTESLFPNAQLVEVDLGVTSLATLPSHVSPPDWHHTANGQKRLAYILKKDSHAIGVKTPAGRELTRRDLEDAYWRCKTFNNDYARVGRPARL